MLRLCASGGPLGEGWGRQEQGGLGWQDRPPAAPNKPSELLACLPNPEPLNLKLLNPGP